MTGAASSTWVAMAMLAVATAPAWSQEPVGSVGCVECAVEVGAVTVYGAFSDTVGLASLPRAVVRPDGAALFVSDVASASGALVYGSTGDLQGVLGRAGDGPGEMRQALRIAQGDSLTVIQAVDREVHVFGLGGDFKRVVRGVPMSVRNLKVSGDSALVVVSGSRRPAAAPGRIVHLYDAVTGAHRGAVGPDVELDPRRAPAIVDVAVGRDGLWLLQPPDQISQWLPAGMVRSFRWSADWLAEVDASYRGTPLAEAVVEMQGWEDRQRERFWILTLINQGGGREDLLADAQPGGALLPDAFSPTVLHRTFDTVVSVLDLETGAVLAHRLFDEAAVQFLDDGRLLVARDDPTGYLWAEAWELRLEGR